MEGNKETVCQHPPNPPLKRAKLEMPWTDEDEEERWFFHMQMVREWHLTKATFENNINSIIEQTGTLAQSSIEDEGVRMAIRSHGLACCSHNFTYELDPAHVGTLLHATYPTTSFDQNSREDILSQAVTVAICKKGLGLDR